MPRKRPKGRPLWRLFCTVSGICARPRGARRISLYNTSIHNPLIPYQERAGIVFYNGHREGDIYILPCGCMVPTAFFCARVQNLEKSAPLCKKRKALRKQSKGQGRGRTTARGRPGAGIPGTGSGGSRSPSSRGGNPSPFAPQKRGCACKPLRGDLRRVCCRAGRFLVSRGRSRLQQVATG